MSDTILPTTRALIRKAQFDAEQARNEVVERPYHLQAEYRRFVRKTLSPLAQAWFDAIL